MDSILTTTKALLGIEESVTHFDVELVVYINSALMVLQQLGVGPVDGYFITNEAQLWSEFLDGRTDLELVKSYVYLKTKLVFDPPQSGFVLESIDRVILQYEWRLTAQVDVPPIQEVVEDEI